jgi:hypothetical protein
VGDPRGMSGFKTNSDVLISAPTFRKTASRPQCQHFKPTAMSQTKCQHLKPNRDVAKLAPTFRNQRRHLKPNRDVSKLAPMFRNQPRNLEINANLEPSTNTSKPTLTREATLIPLKPHQTRTRTHEIPQPAPRVRVFKGTGRGRSGDTPGLPVPITKCNCLD